MREGAAEVMVLQNIASLRAQVAKWRAAGERVALVPTMGALHRGHISLVEEGRKRADRVVVSIFVNPTQFAPHEDFSTYPRTLEADLAQIASAHGDACFTPSVAEMYPDGAATTVSVAGPALADLEDRFRPTHFAGVATIVAKLLNQARADVAIFGQKDFQQLMVVTQMARDLDIATEIVGAATVREPDGLAMSSRNVYLSPAERGTATVLHRSLNICAQQIRDGAPVAQAVSDADTAIADAGFAIDYCVARKAANLAPVTSLREGPLRLLVAAKIGRTRLIDNIAV